MTHLDLINVTLSLWVQPMLMIALLMVLSRNLYTFSAASRHWYFVCVFVAVSIALFVKTFMPAIQLPAIPFSQAYWFAVPLWDIRVQLCIFGGIYFLGVLWFMGYQLMGLFDIWMITNRSRPAEEDLNQTLQNVRKHFSFSQNVGLKVTNELSGPIVWGFIFPTIILPASYANWDNGRLSRVLAHECAHIERKDFITKILGKWLCAIFWIVPLVWLVNRKIEWYAELACDDKVISVFETRDEYAEDLLSISSKKETLTWALAFVQNSKLYLRIQYVLDGRNQREDVSTKQKVFQLLLLFVLVLPLALLSLGISFDRWSPVNNAISEDSLESTAEHTATPLREVFDQRINDIKKMQSLIQIIPGNKARPEEGVTVFYEAPQFNVDVRPEPPITEVATKEAPSIRVPNIEIQGVVPLELVVPSYPRKALMRGIEGKVVVVFDISPNGEVKAPRILHSSGVKDFEVAAIKAIKKSRFSPMLLNGDAITTRNITETYYFKLSATEEAPTN